MNTRLAFLRCDVFKSRFFFCHLEPSQEEKPKQMSAHVTQRYVTQRCLENAAPGERWTPRNSPMTVPGPCSNLQHFPRTLQDSPKSVPTLLGLSGTHPESTDDYLPRIPATGFSRHGFFRKKIMVRISFFFFFLIWAFLCFSVPRYSAVLVCFFCLPGCFWCSFFFASRGGSWETPRKLPGTLFLLKNYANRFFKALGTPISDVFFFLWNRPVGQVCVF